MPEDHKVEETAVDTVHCDWCNNTYFPEDDSGECPECGREVN